jgi:hypothetical protein
MMIPIMAASLIAYGTSRVVCREALYKALAENFFKRCGESKSEKIN